METLNIVPLSLGVMSRSFNRVLSAASSPTVIGVVLERSGGSDVDLTGVCAAFWAEMQNVRSAL